MNRPTTCAPSPAIRSNTETWVTRLACLVALAGAAASAATFPTLTVQPTGYASLSQTGGSLVTLQAVSTAVPGVGGLGNSLYSGNDYALTASLTFTNTNTELGLAARANAGTMSLYELSLNPANGYLALVKITGGSSFANLAAEQITGFASTKDYTITLSVTGDALTGYLYEAQSLVSTLHATDASFTTGQVGVFALQHNGALIDGTWTNLSMVPEPVSLSLLGLAGTLVLVRRRQR